MTYIYGLCEPGTDNIRYVGKSGHPEARLIQHLQEARGYCKSRKCLWLRELMAADKEPDIIILEEVERRWWSLRERHWIQKLHRQGHNLLNRAHTGVRMSVRVDSDLHLRVKAMSLQWETNVSETVTRLLERALELEESS